MKWHQFAQESLPRLTVTKTTDNTFYSAQCSLKTSCGLWMYWCFWNGCKPFHACWVSFYNPPQPLMQKKKNLVWCHFSHFIIQAPRRWGPQPLRQERNKDLFKLCVELGKPRARILPVMTKCKFPEQFRMRPLARGFGGEEWKHTEGTTLIPAEVPRLAKTPHTLVTVSSDPWRYSQARFSRPHGLQITSIMPRWVAFSSFWERGSG